METENRTCAACGSLESNHGPGGSRSYCEFLPPREKVKVRLVAEYQLMSDLSGHNWANRVLGKALDDERLEEYNVTGVYTGMWGLQLVTFTADILVDPITTYEAAKEYGKWLLCEIVGDSMEVRWVAPC
jgi:hypothetical protein